MEYTVVDETNKYSLVGHVLTCIEQGWKPQGGVSICTYGSEMHYTQAMIRGDK